MPLGKRPDGPIQESPSPAKRGLGEEYPFSPGEGWSKVGRTRETVGTGRKRYPSDMAPYAGVSSIEVGEEHKGQGSG